METLTRNVHQIALSSVDDIVFDASKNRIDPLLLTNAEPQLPRDE
jgi:hypothetical protein